jgi:hypothetical protein
VPSPIVTRVLPESGHTGGRQLIEISGGNFPLPPKPPAGVVPVPVRNPDVAVYFGDAAALEVEVWSEQLIYCQSPILDPIQLEQAVTVLGNVFARPNHHLAAGRRVEMKTSGTLPAPLKLDKAYYVVSVDAGHFSLAESPGGAVVALTTAGTGAHLVVSSGAYDVTVQNLDQSGEPIDDQLGTLARAFTPVRPDLSVEGHLTTTVGQFVLELRRQVLDNVAWTTHTDYDDTTGDSLNIVYLSRLPGIVLAGVSFPDSEEVRQLPAEDSEASSPDTFITSRPPVVVDFVGNIVGASDNDAELLNLLQAVKLFFKKNTVLRVPRRYGDVSLGYVEYEMRASMGAGGARVQPVGDETNVQYFSGEFRVVGIRLEQMPGVPTESVPGVPEAVAGESVISIGKTAETIEVEIVKKPA